MPDVPAMQVIAVLVLGIRVIVVLAMRVIEEYAPEIRVAVRLVLRIQVIWGRMLEDRVSVPALATQVAIQPW